MAGLRAYTRPISIAACRITCATSSDVNPSRWSIDSVDMTVFTEILDRGIPFTDDTGTFAGFIGSCVDVDERRKAQEAQQHATRSSSRSLAISRSGFWRS